MKALLVLFLMLVLAGCSDDAGFPSNEPPSAVVEQGKPGQQKTDIDGDGITNADDNCPANPNPDQSDIDGDGTGDECDSDKDGDKVLNQVDNCPDMVNPDQADIDGDGLGDICDADRDGDG